MPRSGGGGGGSGSVFVSGDPSDAEINPQLVADF